MSAEVFMSALSQCNSVKLFSALCAFAITGLHLAGCAANQKNYTVADIEVPDGFTVEKVAGADLVEYPMFARLDDAGRLFLFESVGNIYENSQDAIDNPRFRINMLEDVDGDGVYDESTIFADSLSFPQGGVFHDGSMIASVPPDLMRFTDTDGDGVADEREVLLSGWVLNVNANSLIGPFEGPDGWLYMTSAIEGFDVTTQEGERIQGSTARIWRVRPDGSDLEWVSAGGMNNPVELTFMPTGDVIGTETYFTNPKAGYRDALVHWVKGGVYPKPNTNIQEDSLIRTGDLMPVVHKYARVTPVGITRYRSSVFGEEYQDNLFSARFNTHRVVRHVPVQDGATFKTEDTPFFTLDDPDFHPTDVLEDADGSLLVIETGGWFIKGCPLSQVSKPEIEGAIYRVRKEAASTVEDPRGKQLNLANASPAELVGYLNDPRPVVRDRAVDRLVEAGNASVDPLSRVIEQSASASVRLRAVFTLYRLETPKALTGVREGLDDGKAKVRVAAARSVGLAGDEKAIEKLIDLVRNDEPAVRRQAATALGQIGDPRAVDALLDAARDPDDRFVEHAIIYSLITLGRGEPLLAGLDHSDPDVRKAALIALDQMDDSPIRADHLRPFLEHENQELHQTGLWVASHHSEWSDVVSDFLQTRLGAEALAAGEERAVSEVLISFCGDAGVQNLVASLLESSSIDVDRKLYLLDTIQKCSLEEFPDVWKSQIGGLVQAPNLNLRARAVDLIQLRGMTGFTDQLETIVDTSSEPAELRVAAMSALVGYQPDISAQQFEFLYSQLRANRPAPRRKSAAEVLGKATLEEKQLLKLSEEYLPEADTFTLLRLLDVFEQGSSNPAVAANLASELRERPRALDALTSEDIRELFANFPAAVDNERDQLLAQLEEVRGNRLERLEELNEQLTDGNITRGRELFFGKSTCSTCHTVGSEGGTLGPDLTSIGQVRSRHDILEAIVYPSVSFVREYETYEVTTGAQTQRGVIVRRSPEAIVLQTGPETQVRISRDEIAGMELSAQSMMPQGLDQLLTTQEMADLVAFLEGQDQRPDEDEVILR